MTIIIRIAIFLIIFFQISYCYVSDTVIVKLDYGESDDTLAIFRKGTILYELERTQDHKVKISIPFFLTLKDYQKNTPAFKKYHGIRVVETITCFGDSTANDTIGYLFKGAEILCNTGTGGLTTSREIEYLATALMSGRKSTVPIGATFIVPEYKFLQKKDWHILLFNRITDGSWFEKEYAEIIPELDRSFCFVSGLENFPYNIKSKDKDIIKKFKFCEIGGRCVSPNPEISAIIICVNGKISFIWTGIKANTMNRKKLSNGYLYYLDGMKNNLHEVSNLIEEYYLRIPAGIGSGGFEKF